MHNINKTQNVYDNETFFEGYKALRSKPYTANEAEEKPALFSLLPPLCGSTVLDLGCGFGENCESFSRMGAALVVGVDISEKMLEVAKREHPYATYVREDMNELAPLAENSTLPKEYDIVVSSLAVHYIRDMNKLARQVFSLLKSGGCFLFSQEHPLTTAPINGVEWETDGENTTAYKLSDYGRSGERKVDWFISGVIKYHRTFSELFSALTAAGFTVTEMIEPFPTEEDTVKLPKRAKNLHKPNFLLIKAVKT